MDALNGLAKLFQILGISDPFWMERTAQSVVAIAVVILALLFAYVLTSLLFSETNGQKAQKTRRTYR